MNIKTTSSLIVLTLVFITAMSCTAPSGRVSDSQKPATNKAINGSAANFRPEPDDVAHPKLFPEIGKWMLDPDLTPAHWIGEIYDGKKLREPINVIIVDHLASSPEEAKQRLIGACPAAGYPSREGHSSGYRGYIDGRLYEQLPEGLDDAYSNEPFIINNNHGRIFGPYHHEGKYLFIGAFSREKVAPLASVKHEYVSFNRARDDFAESMSRKTEYKVSGYVNLDNVIADDKEITTGDHDGVAVSIVAGK